MAVLLPGVGPETARAAPEADVTGIFADGWWPDVYFPRRPLTLAGPEAAFRVESQGPSNVIVRATSSSSFDAGAWTVIVASSSKDVPLAVGRMPFAQVTGPEDGCSTYHEGWADVLELERDPDGTVTRFAATLHSRCPMRNPMPDFVHTEVRFHSTIGFRGVDITPMPPPTWPTATPTIDFGRVRVGDAADPRTVTVTNTGTLPLLVEIESQATSAFTIDASACDGVSLDPGRSCGIDTAFHPVAVDRVGTTIVIRTPEIGDVERAATLSGTGTLPTSLGITPIGPPPEDMQLDGMYWFAVTGAPPEATGVVIMDATCTDGSVGARQFGWGPQIQQPFHIWMDLPPGPCEVTGHLYARDGFEDSDAAPVAFEVPSFSRLYVLTSTHAGPLPAAQGRAGEAIVLTSVVEGTNGVDPTGGILRLLDVDAGTTLGSLEVTAETTSLVVDVGVLPPGTHRFRAEYTGDESIVGTWEDFSFLIDGDAPQGSISIGDDLAATPTEDVTLQLSAFDASTAVAAVRVSSAGGTVGGVLASGLTTDATASMPWSLAGPDGTKRVYAQWRDAVGNWSEPVSATVVLDRTRPKAEAPLLRAGPAGSGFDGGRAPVVVTWSGSDAGSGIDHYEVRQSVDGGAFELLSERPAAARLARRLAIGHVYAFEVRAVDRAGNRSTWVRGPARRLAGIQQSSRAVRYTGTWSARVSASWWRGSARTASAAGAAATVRFTGRSVAWVARTGPGRGLAVVYVDGVPVATVDLGAAATSYRRIAWSRTWSQSAAHTVTIRVQGTTGRPRVDLDGFLVVR